MMVYGKTSGYPSPKCFKKSGKRIRQGTANMGKEARVNEHSFLVSPKGFYLISEK